MNRFIQIYTPVYDTSQPHRGIHGSIAAGPARLSEEAAKEDAKELRKHYSTNPGPVTVYSRRVKVTPEEWKQLVEAGYDSLQRL